MKVSTNELLLALRAPNSGWLAALVCALDEALHDPDFGPRQRELVRGLIEQGLVPTAVSEAANERLVRFEQSIEDTHATLVLPLAEVRPIRSARPKLTLCGGAA